MNDRFEYDIVLSFAAEDTTVAEEFAGLLQARNKKVLLDTYQAVELAGGDLVNHIAELYRTKARYCVLLISQHYPLKKWTKAERMDTQEHAFRDADEYILPIRLDSREVPGISETSGYRDLREHSLERIADWIEKKLVETKDRSGPPSKSHDLRSGNVPSTEDEPPV